MAELARLSLNQITTPAWSVAEAAEACARHNIPSIALWRHKIDETGLDACVRTIRDTGLHVSSVCRGGMFPAPTAQARRAAIEDNLRAIDQAAALAADSLVLVVGGAHPVGIVQARAMVQEGLAAIVPHAQACGVTLGLEPLHPMFAADRSVLSTIAQALALAAPYPAHVVSLVLDVFHIWWDPDLDDQIQQAAGRIAGFHVNDWLVPLPDTLLGRGMMGDGAIDNHALRLAVDRAGYHGPIEVEIFNRALWDTHPEQVLQQVIERFTTLV